MMWLRRARARSKEAQKCVLHTDGDMHSGCIVRVLCVLYSQCFICVLDKDGDMSLVIGLVCIPMFELKQINANICIVIRDPCHFEYFGGIEYANLL